MLDKTASVIRKVKDLGMSTPLQLYLAETPEGLIHWVGYGGMGTNIDTPVHPDEMDVILYLIEQKMLVRTNDIIILGNKPAYRIILHVDIKEDTTLMPDNKTPSAEQSFIQKYLVRKQYKPNTFLGLVKVEDENGELQQYAWEYGSEWLDSTLKKVQITNVPIIEDMIKTGTLELGGSHSVGDSTYTELNFTSL